MIGIYKLKRGRGFRCGISCFTLPEGATVKVSQLDKSTGKVLIHFGGRYVEWFSDSILNDFEKVKA